MGYQDDLVRGEEGVFPFGGEGLYTALLVGTNEHNVLTST